MLGNELANPMSAVIFDLDDTLIDFAATRNHALEEIADFLFDRGFSGDGFVYRFGEIDRQLFSKFENGLMSRSEYRRRRFADTLFAEGHASPKESLVTALNNIFMETVNDHPMLFDDVRPALRLLRGLGVHVAVLTNGPADGQRRKIRAAGLVEHVDYIGIGEEIGVSKPMPSAYQTVISKLAVNARQSLMIGDSPAMDYDGALQAGLSALLLDRAGVHASGPRRRIASLLQLPEHLANIQ